MVKLQMKIKNSAQIKQAFGRAPQIMSTKLKFAIEESTFLVQKESQRETPARTTFLKSSYVARFRGTGINFVGTTGPTAVYGIFVHDGTRFQKANPFMERGLAKSEAKMQDFFTDSVQDALNKVGSMT